MIRVEEIKQPLLFPDIEEKKNEKINLVVGMSIFNSIEPTTTIDLCHLATSGLVNGIVISEGALLPNSRNICVKGAFRDHPAFTHLLLIDNDINNIKVEMVRDLIAADKDIIGPIYCSRNPPFFPIAKPETQHLIGEQLTKPQNEREIIECQGFGTGCMLIKRKVLEATGPDWFTLDRRPRETFFSELNEFLEKNQDLDKLAMFQAGVKLGLNAHLGTDVVGEDYNFCEKAIRMGFKCFLHSGYYVGHVGRVTYDLRDWIAFNEKTPDELRLHHQTLIWRNN